MTTRLLTQSWVVLDFKGSASLAAGRQEFIFFLWVQDFSPQEERLYHTISFHSFIVNFSELQN